MTSPPSASVEELARNYEQRRARFAREADALGARSLRIGNLRGVSFVTGLGGFAYAVFGAGGNGALAVGAAGILIFFALIVHHALIIEAEEHKRRWTRVNEHGHARCTEGWRRLEVTGEELRPERHAYADDLDLFGKGSLFQRISVAHTRYGQRTLAEWLLRRAPTPELRARQEAVRALAPELEFRQAFEAEGLAIVERRGRQPGSIAIGESPDPEPLLRWAETPPDLLRRKALIAAAWFLPPCTIAGLVASFGFGQPLWAWGIPLAAQIAILTAVGRSTSETFVAVSFTEGAFLRYGAMLELVENLQVDSPWVRARQARLRSAENAAGASKPGGSSAAPPSPSSSMRSFRRRVGWYDLRHNGMAHPFINALLLWDVHCTLALESWKVHSGRHARNWFAVLGELEAISSLAGLLHDEPSFCLPEFLEAPRADEGADRPLVAGAEAAPEVDADIGFAAEGLGHPLLVASRRVTNDVEAIAPGHALLVTGSNMSGKSTFLRSVGTACVLAFAGGPVCARSLRIRPCHLGTSIRVSDSLASGVSHFYAEIEKLKAVVDATAGGAPVLFLLDEILHGTNSRERQVGARWVLAELLERSAFGVVTTHDMELCQLTPELMNRVRQAHFRESVRDEKMTFDYQLREGPVHAGNALRLMQLVGLDVPLA